MQIKLEQDPQLSEPEITIRTATAAAGEALRARLEAPAPTLAVMQGTVEHFLPLSAVIFIETEGRQRQVHTPTDMYISKVPLHTLADQLPGTFLQISKSTIVNLLAVSAINRSLANCLVSFTGTHKQVYASRRYYHLLTERIHEMRGIDHE